MLKKQFRLKNSSAIFATYKNNKRISDNNIHIYFGKEKTDPSYITKFAFIVSKKVHKRAVKRNRIKRLLRENIKLILKNPEYDFINKYLSVVIVGKTGALDSDFEGLKSSVQTLLKKACL